MSTVIDRVKDFAGWIAKGKIVLPEVVAIPAGQCFPAASVGDAVIRDRDYFSITINELFLIDARFGLATFDPLVVATTSFIYGDRRISVPSIVGPSLLKQDGKRLPQGVVLHDTTVAGPYPFRGGPVAISLVLYRVRHRDYAKDLLRLVESVWGAIGASADMGLLSKVGGPLIDGLDDLLGMSETEPIAGHRIELGPSKPAGFRTCFSALIDGNQTPVVDHLRVEGGRLRISTGAGESEKFTAADYVLYSVARSKARYDERTLPFYPIYERALKTAASGGDDAWKAAKASFAELWQQMITSPDLTKEQAHQLLAVWRSDLLRARDEGINNQEMSVTEESEVDEGVTGAAAVLGL